MTNESYAVRGMTCGHCAAAVTEELTKIPGVSDVQVDVASGVVRVSSAEPLASKHVAAAVGEAGYQLVGRLDSAD